MHLDDHDPADARRRTRRAVAVVLGLVAALAVGATVAGAQTSEPSPSQASERGLDLYNRHCATCHGPQGAGGTVSGREVPPIDGAPPALIDFVIRTGRMPLPSINAESTRRTAVLAARDRQAIVEYVQTFAPDEPAVPEVAPERGDLAQGEALYANNCIACHSAVGRGVAVSQEDIAPGLSTAAEDPVEIAEAVRAGPGVMPLFGQRSISDQEMDSLVRYVQWLTQERPTPGGLTIGRSGPVTEGFLAWAAGIGLLLVAVYFIGERRE